MKPGICRKLKFIWLTALIFSILSAGWGQVLALSQNSTQGNSLTKLPYHVTDVVIDPEKPLIFMISKGTKTAYAFNYETGETKTVQFDLLPESIDLGKGKNSNELYVTLLKGDHSRYWWEKDQKGAVAVVDKESLAIKDIMDMNLDPYDIVAARDGFLYIPSGSGQYSS